jgi:hypothetical protein
MNPSIGIPECSPAEKSQEHDVGCTAFGVEHSGPHRGLAGGSQDETREFFPMGRRHGAIGNRERGAKDLRHQGSMLSRGFGRLHVMVHADAQLPANDVGLSGIQCAEVTCNGVEAGARAQRVAVLHLPQGADWHPQSAAQCLPELR